jgi:UDP-N-acetylmuramyl pentapeptide synthase
LQRLARYHRQQFHPLTIGITGSNGKTIVKEWLYQLLADRYKIVRSPRSYNSQIGVPLSVLQLASQHELALFEAGISQTGEMERLAPIIDCQMGILTYLGDAHRQGFASKEEKLREKLQLFRSASHLIYSADQPDVDRIIQEELPSITKLAWTSGTTGFISGVHWESTGGSSRLSAIYRDTRLFLEIPFDDQASRTNALHCLCVLLHLGYSPSEVQPLLKNLEAIAMRLEMKAGINQTTVINDAYNADLASLNIALQFLDQQNPQGRRTLILSDLLETGYPAPTLYSKVAELIREKKVQRLIAIGREVQRLESMLPEQVALSFYPDTDDFLGRFQPADFQRETILLKGARAFEFERIADRLALKAHNTVLEIDLNALKHNLEYFHQHLQPSTKVLVMVKAGAYGSGAFEIARLLEFQQVDYLGVAYADEGIELRKAGIQTPILVLNPEEASFAAMKRYQLEPEIYSLRILKQWLNSGVYLDHPGIHLKLETGMNRLGFSEPELPQVLELLQEHPGLTILSVFSHLAASEEAIADEFTHQQAALFQNLAQQIPGNPVRHLLNSSGSCGFRNTSLRWYDWV